MEVESIIKKIVTDVVKEGIRSATKSSGDGSGVTRIKLIKAVQESLSGCEYTLELPKAALICNEAGFTACNQVQRDTGRVLDSKTIAFKLLMQEAYKQISEIWW